MKIFNHKQLLIILKPKYNYPIICKLIINKLRKDRFNNKQNKLLNNLLNYKIKVDDVWYDRFHIYEKYDPRHFYLNTFNIIDNSPYYYYKIIYNFSWNEADFDLRVSNIMSLYYALQIYTNCYDIKFIK